MAGLYECDGSMNDFDSITYNISNSKEYLLDGCDKYDLSLFFIYVNNMEHDPIDGFHPIRYYEHGVLIYDECLNHQDLMQIYDH